MVSYARDSRPSHCSSTSECNSTFPHIHIICTATLLLAISCFPIAHFPCLCYISFSLFLSLPFTLQFYAIIIMVMQTSFLYALLHLLLFCTTSSCFVCIHTSCGFTSSSLHSLDRPHLYLCDITISSSLFYCAMLPCPWISCRACTVVHKTGHMT